MHEMVLLSHISSCGAIFPRLGQGCVKVGMSTLSRPAGRIEGCGVEPFTPFDTRSALLRTLTSVTLT